VPHEELREVTELGDGEVGSEGCLLSFFSNNTNTYTSKVLEKKCFSNTAWALTNVSSLYHAYIITTISNAANPFLGVVSN
jgi:hypothetical protein